MPTSDDPRVPVRMSKQDYAAIEAAASSVNVAVGALIRQCAVQYASTVAAAVARGELTLRRQRVPAVTSQVEPHPVVSAASRIAALRAKGVI